MNTTKTQHNTLKQQHLYYDAYLSQQSAALEKQFYLSSLLHSINCLILCRINQSKLLTDLILYKGIQSLNNFSGLNFKSLSKMNNHSIKKGSKQFHAELRKHQCFLQKFTVLPQKSRKIIYSSCLCLPINHQHFLQSTKPYKLLIEHTDNKQTAFIVSTLTRLYPTLNSQWLPGIVYPFVKLFYQDSVTCFESALSFLLNWYHPLFENYPNTSKKMIGLAKQYLKPLERKLNSLDYGLNALLSPMTLVCLTDTLNRKDFMQLLDYLIVRPYQPELFLCALIAIVEIVQQDLLKMKTVEEISAGLKKEKNIKVTVIIQRAVQISQENKQVLESMYSRSLFPLPKGRYPNFSFTIPKEERPKLNTQKYQQGNQIHELTNKYTQLQQMINETANQQNQHESVINSQYEEHEGQIRQYLNKIKVENSNKQRAFQQIEQKFRNEINSVSGSGLDKNLSRITKRGNLENQILQAKNESRKIKEIQEDFLERMRAVAQEKKDQLTSTDQYLKTQAKQCYSQYEFQRSA